MNWKICSLCCEAAEHHKRVLHIISSHRPASPRGWAPSSRPAGPLELQRMVQPRQFRCFWAFDETEFPIGPTRASADSSLCSESASDSMFNSILYSWWASVLPASTRWQSISPTCRDERSNFGYTNKVLRQLNEWEDILSLEKGNEKPTLSGENIEFALQSEQVAQYFTLLLDLLFLDRLFRSRNCLLHVWHVKFTDMQRRSGQRSEARRPLFCCKGSIGMFWKCLFVSRFGESPA